MTTEKFSRQEFETALPVDKDGNQLWQSLGLNMGEYTYIIPIKNGTVKRVAIMIRSSVDISGYAAATGKDSIRLWLVNSQTNKPLGEKVDAYTTRVSGWQERMTEKLRTLYARGLEMHDCPKCETGIMVERTGKYGKFYGCNNYPNCKHTMKSLPVVNEIKEEVKPVEKEQISMDLLEEVLSEPETSKPVSKPVKLNEQQLAYVNAPINANLRVMAGPGSGKTTATIERIIHLIQNGVNPDSIVYTTFSKDMADEGYKRILSKLPEVANTNMAKQVCTIHALCFRMLSWEGLKSEVAKEWQIKKALSEIIDEVWENNPEKPGYSEVLFWINNAKLNGLTANEDYSFYFQYMGNLAAYVHEARVKFDAQMEAQHLITFADMTYKVEQMLIRNRNFREKYQAKFTHILVDEAQDTNAQALRILITLSLEPGKNTVYRN